MDETSASVSSRPPPRRPAVLMCPPDYYGIEYEINPWMSRSRGADSNRAHCQWQRLYETIRRLDADVSLLEPVPGLPDMVFTANAGLVFHRRFVSARFRPQVRQGEVPHFESWFESAGFQVHHLPQDLFHEGAGDALFCGSVLFGGYRIRSDARSHQYVANLLGCQVLPLELVDPRFYHLDTCFCPIDSSAAIWYPPAFDDYGRQVVRQNIADLIEVTHDDAMRFGCNAVIVHRSAIISADCAALSRELEARRFTVHEVELDEFLKAGGSAKCLTLRIDGEDAAAWPAT